MTDQFETVGSLDFGQQAMNVVVRAKINASTDYASLTASLLAQRDMKQKPIRELEVKVLKELAPQLDEVVKMERECKRAALEVEIAEERDEKVGEGGADEPLVARAETDAEADAQIRRCARTAAGDAGDDGDDAALPTGFAYSFSQWSK